MEQEKGELSVNAGLTACSNGQAREKEQEICQLVNRLSAMGIHTVQSRHLYAVDGVFSASAKERAKDLMAFYEDPGIDVIYDISGGDIANEILNALDYEVIQKSGKMFWGYSDLTTVINAVYAKTGMPSVLYQVKNLTKACAKLQQQRFQDALDGTGNGLYNIDYQFLQGSGMEGIVTGGNVRCLLNLAGTAFWPDMKGKILLLEALGGEAPQLAAYFAQLDQMGVFADVCGVLLGTFTRFEQTPQDQTVYSLLRPHIRKDLPVAKTPDIGHGPDAKAIVIGKYAGF